MALKLEKSNEAFLVKLISMLARHAKNTETKFMLIGGTASLFLPGINRNVSDLDFVFAEKKDLQNFFNSLKTKSKQKNFSIEFSLSENEKEAFAGIYKGLIKFKGKEINFDAFTEDIAGYISFKDALKYSNNLYNKYCFIPKPELFAVLKAAIIASRKDDERKKAIIFDLIKAEKNLDRKKLLEIINSLKTESKERIKEVFGSIIKGKLSDKYSEIKKEIKAKESKVFPKKKYFR